MGQIKAIALDFDNCIILDEETRKGSEEVKDEAWFTVFPEIDRETLTSVLEKVKKEIAGGKGDRKDIARRVQRHFCLGLNTASTSAEEINHKLNQLLEQEAAARCNAYNRTVQEGIKEIGVSEQTRQALDELSKKMPVFVNSATPRDGILESINALGIRDYFTEVYGRPGTKVENLQNIVAAESIYFEELFFVGDQQSDCVAAHEVGCQFVGIHTARNTRWDGRGAPFQIIFHLRELLPIVYDFRW